MPDPTSLASAARDLLLGGRCAACDRPGSVLCSDCAERLPGESLLARGPTRPDPCPPGMPDTWACGAYGGPLRSLLLAHKEHGQHALAGPLGELLGQAVDGLVAAALVSGAAPVLLVPVPSRPAAVRSRGRDPTRALVRSAARMLTGGSVVLPARLLSTRPGLVDQSELGSEERAANLHGSLRVRTSGLRALADRVPEIAGVVVCDDVVTTGATLVEASRALRAVGLPVLGAATVAATRRRRPRPT